MKQIHLWGINQNNLNNVDVEIPVGQFTVVCGPSGSGKSSLAFDTLFAEGQRRFIESMSNYSKQFLAKAPKPDVEGVENIPPAIAIEQKNGVRSSRSTVGTTTEVLDHLRLLFEKLGIAHCPTHSLETKSFSPSAAAQYALEKFNSKKTYLLVEVDEKNRSLKGKKLLQQLAEDGYVRIYKPNRRKKEVPVPDQPYTSTTFGEVVEIASLIKRGLPLKTFYIVIDRLVINEKSLDRIVDSIDLAYSASLSMNVRLTGPQAYLLSTDGEKLKLSDFNTCPVCDFTPPQLTTGLFSFNNPLGACPDCKGFGNTLDIDEAKVIPNDDLSLLEGAIAPFEMPSAKSDKRELKKFCESKKINMSIPWKKMTKRDRQKIWQGTPEFYGVLGAFDYLETKKYKMHVRVFLSRYKSPTTCRSCGGSRIRKETESIQLKGHSIQELSRLTIEKLAQLFSTFDFSANEMDIIEDPLSQIRARLAFLLDVGVGYLSLDRETKTLSGGEYQRTVLANQLGMGLSQSLYVLDEPTVGLHPRDSDRLVNILKRLKELENTLVVVEHDHDVIRSSDNIIEMGPGSGVKGGDIIYNGPTDEFIDFKDSNTANLVFSQQSRGLGSDRSVNLDTIKYKITLNGCTGNNLQNIDIEFPLNRLVCVTGVSGSGKSSLVTGTLYPAVAKAMGIDHKKGLPFKRLDGFDDIKNIVLIDQTPIGKSARSSPVTYLKIYDTIRQLLADTRDAKLRGYTPGTFSLNVDGGRCPVCKGIGFEEVDMMFMDNIRLICDACDGKKFRAEILEIKYKKKNVHQILQLTVYEAMEFFVSSPNVRKALALLCEVGLEYLQLGQVASTLSGGESQRLKIAKELSQIKQRNTLYILDEPTTGLHFREVEMLMSVLHKLVDGGGSVLVVEHNLDVIRNSDFIIDIGPEAGEDGGQVLFKGSPKEIVKCKKSHTGNYLKQYTEKKKGSGNKRSQSTTRSMKASKNESRA